MPDASIPASIVTDTLAGADAAGQAALLEYFDGGDEEFRDALRQALDEVLADARAASERAGLLSDKIYGALVVRLDRFGPGGEARLRWCAATVAPDLLGGHRDQMSGLVEAILAAGGLDAPGDAAGLLVDAATGISLEDQPRPVRQIKLRQLAELVAGDLRQA